MIIKINVKGQVQGVFFRANAKTVAENLRLTGTARNLDNGDLEFYVQGEKEQLEQFVYFCQKGTMTSKIENVQAVTVETPMHFEDFNII